MPARVIIMLFMTTSSVAVHDVTIDTGVMLNFPESCKYGVAHLPANVITVANAPP